MLESAMMQFHHRGSIAQVPVLMLAVADQMGLASVLADQTVKADLSAALADRKEIDLTKLADQTAMRQTMLVARKARYWHLAETLDRIHFDRIQVC
jgi:hypothetical protein